MLFLNYKKLFTNSYNSYFKNRFFQPFTRNLLNLTFLFDISQNSSFGFSESLPNPVFLSIEHIKVQELSFLSEYFLITALFFLTLFALFSLTPVTGQKQLFIKFQYNSQLIFLLIFTLICYLTLVYQQINFSVLTLSSFNDSIINDPLAITAKFIVGFASICYLIFIPQYLKDQKLSNFEYYILLLTSIFGFFLLCCTNDFITAYLAIELQGLAFYVLAAFKKSSNFSIESGIKYFVIGSLSTALFLLGVTFVYGFTGSLILTDFNDFFTWAFSINSAFLPFESVIKGLDMESSSIVKLQDISDSLDLIKQKIYYQTDFTVPYNNQLQLNYITSSLNTFLIESSFESSSMELFYNLQDDQITSGDFTNFKNSLIEANFYQSVGSEDLTLTDTSFNFLKLSDTLLLSQYLGNIYYLLESCYLSEQILNLVQFVESLKVQDEILGENILESFESRVYMFSIINVLSINNLVLDFGPELLNEVAIEFDFSFVIFGMIILLLALLFKLALAPFHAWSPDVYEGSPTSSTFFFMVISKLGIFIFLIRICYLSFYSFMSYWQFYSILVATCSIFIGAVAGLKQRKLKSLLTYSSINNMGFVLLAFSIGSFEGVQLKFYYLIVYMLTSLCVWGIILSLKLKKKMYSEKQNRDLGDLALLQESNNIIAQNLAIVLFSMAGLPPLVGFLAKMGVFKALTGVSMYFFAVVNILFSVIATFYYLRIIKIIFFENLLVGSLYTAINSKKVFLINFLNFLLGFLFISPMFLYLYSYKITLFINKGFY